MLQEMEELIKEYERLSMVNWLFPFLVNAKQPGQRDQVKYKVGLIVWELKEEGRFTENLGRIFQSRMAQHLVF